MPEMTLLPVGRIRKAHGIKGEVSVEYYAESPLLLREGIFLRSPGNGGETRHYEVASYRMHHGALLLMVRGVADRNAAELLRGFEVCIPESRLPEPEDGEVYRYQIMGLAVIDATKDTANGGATLGTITMVTEHAGQELWTITKPGAEDILFPVAPEFVLEFDLDAHTVRIAPPSGLVEIYRP